MDEVVAITRRLSPRRESQTGVQQNLWERRTYADASHEGRTGRSDDPEIRELHVCTDRVGDEIDLMTELHQRFDPVIFAERRAARLEEWLRGEHQNLQRTHRRGHSGTGLDIAGQIVASSAVNYTNRLRARSTNPWSHVGDRAAL